MNFVYKFVFFNFIFITFISISSSAFGFENSFSAEIINTYQKYFHNFKNVEDQQNYLQIKIKNTSEINNTFQLNLNPEYRVLQNLNTKLADHDFEFHDTNLEMRLNNSSLRIGFFHLKKEGADIFDPLDYFESKNLSNPIKMDKKSILGFKFEHELSSKFLLETVFSPKQSVTKLPNTNSPWFPRENKLPTANQSYQLNIPESVEYQIQSNDAKNQKDLTNAWLVKIKMIFSSVDWIFQVAESTSSQPIITPTLNGALISTTPYVIELNNPILLDINWTKSKYYGTGIVKTFSESGLIFKFFYNLESNNSNKDSVAIALEKQILDHTFIIEHSRQFLKTEDSAQLVTSSNLFADAWGLGVRLVITEKISSILGGIYDSNSRGYIFNVKNKYQINDHWYLELNYMNLYGPTSSLLSHFDKNDNLSLAIGALF